MKPRKNNSKPNLISWDSILFQYSVAVFVVVVTALICIPIASAQGYHVVSFIMLFVVSTLATILGIGPILLASTLSSLIWNFFFIPPHYTFHISKTEDILLFFMFFFIALLNGTFTSRLRKQEKITRDREARTNSLFQLTKDLSKAVGIDEVQRVTEANLEKYFSVSSFLILQDGNNLLENKNRLNAENKLSSTEFKVASWVFENSKKAGKHTEDFPSAFYTYYPLVGTRIVPGVLAIKLEEPFVGDKIAFWNAFITLISNALEREFLGELVQKGKILEESDKLYKTLFSSISHELRIPVATIMGASDTLMTLQSNSKIQSELNYEISIASLRLNRLIENLLNMSRLESGRISIRLDWYDINDLLNKVVDELKEELKPFRLSINIQDEMPLVRFDFGLMEQVLYNLVLNACQHAPLKSSIRLNVRHNGGMLIIEVLDRGAGFPEGALSCLFDKFYRVSGSKTGGLGLGLSIVKGFVDAHKGNVSVGNRKNGGAKFTVKIPTPDSVIEEIS
ncbi:hypothetical protein CYCD_20460 [Tenuifilaceae bacterium CYCD]|nr:hypothetical protein CYCD_20460 [Tenuifilaceae bacterium CYCD]